VIRMGFDRVWSYEAPDINNVNSIKTRSFWYLHFILNPASGGASPGSGVATPAL